MVRLRPELTSPARMVGVRLERAWISWGCNVGNLPAILLVLC